MNFLKRLLSIFTGSKTNPDPNSEAGEGNHVHNIDTKLMENDDGEFEAIVMGLEIHDKTTLEPFVAEVIDQFKNQRMMSPPDTANMLITIHGDCSAEEFVAHWQKISDSDDIMKHFMSTMVLADVLRFTDEAGVTDQASLIPG